uniref:Uncharacterized protein n=1 Tax=Arundo donax TaxID=35708 RepID=A0A0A9HFP4_ARUDO
MWPNSLFNQNMVMPEAYTLRHSYNKCMMPNIYNYRSNRHSYINA